MDTSKQMPDLGAATQGAGDQHRRILAQLEHGPRMANASGTSSISAGGTAVRRWAIDGWTVGLVLLLLFMGCIAWLLRDEAYAPPRWKSQHARAEAAPQAVTAAAAAAAAASPRSTAATPSGGARPAAQPAMIISDPVLAVVPAINPLTPISTTAKASNAAAPKPPSKTAGSARAPSTASATSTTMPKPSKPLDPRTSGADTDVALLSALVAHAGTPAKVSPARSRDVVEAHDGEATASLLARCLQLGPIEGMLCRSRICADRWDADPACRVPPNGLR